MSGLDVGLLFAGSGAVGAATSLLLAKIATKYGHTFMQLGSTNPYLIALIGVVYSISSMFLFGFVLGEKRTNWKIDLAKFISAHVVIGTVLLGLTALAQKVNLIAGRLTLFGTATLIETSIIGNMACILAIAAGGEDSGKKPSSSKNQT